MWVMVRPLSLDTVNHTVCSIGLDSSNQARDSVHVHVGTVHVQYTYST